MVADVGAAVHFQMQLPTDRTSALPVVRTAALSALIAATTPTLGKTELESAAVKRRRGSQGIEQTDEHLHQKCVLLHGAALADAVAVEFQVQSY